MLPHYFEHFKNPVLIWVAIVCWVGARSSEISVFFCHLAKLICSNDNVTIVIPCCCRKKKERFCSCLLQISAGIIQSVPKKLCCVYTSANETEPVSRASPWQVPSTCSSQQVRLTAPWHFLGLCPNVSQGDFLCRRTKRFFTIRTKITSANEYENNFFQPGEVAIASDTSALTTKLMHCEEALFWGPQFFLINVTQTSLHPCLFLCHLPCFWTHPSMCKFIAASRPVIMSGCQAETSDGSNFSNLMGYNTVLTARVGSGSAPLSCSPRFQSP